jgi:hypothetical protein
MTAPAVSCHSPSDVADLRACASDAARLLKLLASEQRLLLLCRLADGEASSGANVTFHGQPKQVREDTSSGGSVRAR